jgi:superfamily II DNA/RNA helicase
VDRLAKQLARVGVRAGSLHGGKSQNLRTRTLAEFREGSIGVLVATDVAARGIHVDDVSLVVHIDPPADHKGYLHRAGRTARAGERGTVVTLVLPHQVRSTSALTRRAGVEAARTKVTAGDAELVRVTGARTPSGEPITEPAIPFKSKREGRRNGRSGDKYRGEHRAKYGKQSRDRADSRDGSYDNRDNDHGQDGDRHPTQRRGQGKGQGRRRPGTDRWRGRPSRHS